MLGFLQLPEDRRRLIIEQVGARTGMNVNAIEKDWWVTLALKAVFSLPMKQYFIFKGGTSLSKGWKLIERFSEDIDIALAPEAFGSEYKLSPSHSYVKSLKKKGCAFTSTVILGALTTELKAMGVPEGLLVIEAEEVKPTLPDKDPQAIYVRYPSLFDPNPYISAAVKIEFGVRSFKEPFKDVNIQSIIAEVFPNPAYSETPFAVPAVEPRKTFIEKLFLLHEKFAGAGAEDDIAERQSRHLADLGCMTTKGIAEEVFNDTELYTALLEHRKYYIRLRNIDYNAMGMSSLSIIPPPRILGQFKKDYETMRAVMIYGDSPDFETLMGQLKELNDRLAAHSADKQDGSAAA